MNDNTLLPNYLDELLPSWRSLNAVPKKTSGTVYFVHFHPTSYDTLKGPAKDILEKLSQQIKKVLPPHILFEHLSVPSDTFESVICSNDLLIPLGSQALQWLDPNSPPLHLVQGTLRTVARNNSQQKTQTLSYLPLFHPEMLSINTSLKRPTWESLKQTLPLLPKLVSTARSS